MLPIICGITLDYPKLSKAEWHFEEMDKNHDKMIAHDEFDKDL